MAITYADGYEAPDKDINEYLKGWFDLEGDLRHDQHLDKEACKHAGKNDTTPPPGATLLQTPVGNGKGGARRLAELLGGPGTLILYFVNSTWGCCGNSGTLACLTIQ
ncbi:hypothetical protein OESDEN_08672 [Oesophagostomum dentatum]|uniref:Uncharacterized protein n=1 Tax=Oesophagostomum dentatum TaxID=61180 RepID=A0A0B1T1M0_OESDE|nr:hypothetical protein OESDEN_08672 [Oesophagostomum dentatum]